MIHITKKMSGKMQGFISINGTTKNAYCQAMQMKSTVCSHCYAETLLKMRPAAERCFARNTEILSRPLDIEDLPKFKPTDVVRFDAFGEIVNYHHTANYFKIALKNPDTRFTLWTKRYKLIQKAVKNMGKPANLILIYSNPKLNTSGILPAMFDKVFNVFSKDSKAVINCGSKSCASCMLCYSSNDVIQINERLK